MKGQVEGDIATQLWDLPIMVLGDGLTMGPTTSGYGDSRDGFKVPPIQFPLSIIFSGESLQNEPFNSTTAIKEDSMDIGKNWSGGVTFSPSGQTNYSVIQTNQNCSNFMIPPMEGDHLIPMIKTRMSSDPSTLYSRLINSSPSDVILGQMNPCHQIGGHSLHGEESPHIMFEDRVGVTTNVLNQLVKDIPVSALERVVPTTFGMTSLSHVQNSMTYMESRGYNEKYDSRDCPMIGGHLYQDDNVVGSNGSTDAWGMHSIGNHMSRPNNEYHHVGDGSSLYPENHSLAINHPKNFNQYKILTNPEAMTHFNTNTNHNNMVMTSGEEHFILTQNDRNFTSLQEQALGDHHHQYPIDDIIRADNDITTTTNFTTSKFIPHSNSFNFTYNNKYGNIYYGIEMAPVDLALFSLPAFTLSPNPDHLSDLSGNVHSTRNHIYTPGMSNRPCHFGRMDLNLSHVTSSTIHEPVSHSFPSTMESDFGNLPSNSSTPNNNILTSTTTTNPHNSLAFHEIEIDSLSSQSNTSPILDYSYHGPAHVHGDIIDHSLPPFEISMYRAPPSTGDIEERFFTNNYNLHGSNHSSTPHIINHLGRLSLSQHTIECDRIHGGVSHPLLSSSMSLPEDNSHSHSNPHHLSSQNLVSHISDPDTLRPKRRTPRFRIPLDIKGEWGFNIQDLHAELDKVKGSGRFNRRRRYNWAKLAKQVGNETFLSSGHCSAKLKAILRKHYPYFPVMKTKIPEDTTIKWGFTAEQVKATIEKMDQAGEKVSLSKIGHLLGHKVTYDGKRKPFADRGDRGQLVHALLRTIDPELAARFERNAYKSCQDSGG